MDKKAILSFFPSLHRFTTSSYPFTIQTSYLVFLLPSLKSQSHFYFPVSLFYFLFPSITPYLYKTPRSGGRIGGLPCKFFQPYRRIQWLRHCYRRDPLNPPKFHASPAYTPKYHKIKLATRPWSNFYLYRIST